MKLEKLVKEMLDDFYTQRGDGVFDDEGTDGFLFYWVRCFEEWFLGEEEG
jgi:hypothetical protein